MTMKPFTLTYPVPLALALMGGIVLASGQLWGALLLLLGLAGALVVTSLWQGRALLITLCLLTTGAGYWRQSTWQAQPNVLSQWQGAHVTLTGTWDGQFLQLSEPDSRVALAPKPAAPVGQLTVSGTLTAPEGQRIPGGFDYAQWLNLQGVHEILVGADVRRSVPEGGLRGWFRQGLSVGLSEQQAALMRAIELGERNDISRATYNDGLNVRDAFTRAGLAHLMALSGQNVALIIGLLTWLLVRLLPARLALWRYPVLIAAVAGFVWLVGPSPSVVRAALMAAFALVGLWAGRGKLDALGVLGLAAIASLLYQSAWLFDVGFQLSFLAVLGLMLSGRVANLLPRCWPHWLRLALVVTPCAEFATLPVVLHNFGQTPLLGFFANLVAGALMSVLVPLGFVAGVLGPAAALLNWVTGLLAQWLLNVVHFFGNGLQLTWGNISPAGFAAYGVFALTAVLALYRRVPFWVLPAVAALLITFTALPTRLLPPREIVYLDVGQGDSSLVRLAHFNMLIDGGGTPHSDYDMGAKTVLPALRALGVRSLNVVVATHADADHIEGLSSVLRGIKVAELWIGQPLKDMPKPDANLAMLLREAERQGVRVRQVVRGDTLRQDEATFTVLWPKGRPWSTADNENSVVVRLDTPHFHTVFLGDLPDPLESALGVGKLDVLKTAHHGSRFSTSEMFLKETQPPNAVISVGKGNTYGHPNPQVLERLNVAGVKVWRTDELGTVRWPF